MSEHVLVDAGRGPVSGLRVCTFYTHRCHQIHAHMWIVERLHTQMPYNSCSHVDCRDGNTHRCDPIHAHMWTVERLHAQIPSNSCSHVDYRDSHTHRWHPIHGHLWIAELALLSFKASLFRIIIQSKVSAITAWCISLGISLVLIKVCKHDF